MPKRKITKTFLERDIKRPETGQVDYFDTATTGFGDVGLTEATAYIYQVSAVNGVGLEGLKSASSTATTLPPSSPARP